MTRRQQHGGTWCGIGIERPKTPAVARRDRQGEPMLTTDASDDDVPVDNLDRANYCLAQIARARRIRDEELDVIRRERDRLDLLAQAAKDRAARVEDWYGAQLESFHAAILRDDPKRKTIDLPAGSLKARQGQPSWTFNDDFLPWATQHAPELVRTKLEVDRPAAKKALQVKDGAAVTVDGELVPGVVVDPAVVTFSVDTQ